jgi:dTDP-4-dehydrorhamnose reductase
MSAANNTVLIVGASGFLGRTLWEIPFDGLRRVPAVRRIRAPYSEGEAELVDITSARQVNEALQRVRPSWVINTAAETGVDACESDPDRAYRLHASGTEILVRACEDVGSGLITISTNYVFDGGNGPYREDDEPNPPNVYGSTKLEGERCALRATCPSVVVRTAVLYGYRPGCRDNFVTWAYGQLVRGGRISVVTDEWSNPTWADELAHFLLCLCSGSHSGVIHFAGRNYMTRYEMVENLCDCYGLDFGLVSPVTSEQLGQPARRPLRAGLRVEKAFDIAPDQRRPFRYNLSMMRPDLPDSGARP